MKQIKKIKNSLLSRQLSTAKISIKTARNLFKNLNENSLKDTLKGTFKGNIDEIVDELDLMKGSLMKAGQMLSLFGGSFLPEELTRVLKKLENQSSYLEWEEIKKQIPVHWVDELDIEEVPLAAASLGQVHIARINDTEYCMKIQYRGVRKAINNDIRTLRLLLKLFNFVPSGIDLKPLFAEIKTMLLLETDYFEEANNTIEFKKLLEKEKSFVVPEVLLKYSNDKILVTEYLKGESLHNLSLLDLTQLERNELGREFMRLFLLEIFVFESVQTDAHFGNYLIIPGEKPKWGLIDFGATKKPPREFLLNYQSLIISLKNQNKDDFIKTVCKMGYLSTKEDSDFDLFWEYAQVIGTPFIDAEFSWGESKIADQVFDYLPRLIKSIKIGTPPSDSFFLDKKLGGVFFVLQKLEANFNMNMLIDEILETVD